ncbi:MAG: hypothetical protein C4324_07000 [Blastocatellia bacterium]
MAVLKICRFGLKKRCAAKIGRQDKVEGLIGMSVLEKVRRWIDGDTAEAVLEQAARDAQVKPRSEAEAFIVKIAREVESVMQKELVPLPQGTAIIPTEYLIFLSEEDDRKWQGIKRRGLEQGLYHILSERAREIAGRRKLETRTFVLELRIDGTLDPGAVRVQHSWEDSSSDKTGILPRPSIPRTIDRQSVRSQNHAGATQSIGPEPKQTLPSPNFAGKQNLTELSEAPQRVEQIHSEDDEIATTVRPRAAELYRLEIWLGGVRQSVVPIYSREISIGRGSKSRPVDIALVGDPEISRRHATLIVDDTGKFWFVSEGKNPASIGTMNLPSGHRVPLDPGTAVSIGRFMIRVQPQRKKD